MCPAKPAVSPSALSRVLDATERLSPASLKTLAEATDLGLSTVTRAVSVCVSHGILRCEAGADPVSNRACSVLLPARGLLLPLLTLTRGHGTARVLDTELAPVGTAVADLAATAPPEEAARLLCRRCLTLLRGCGGGGTVTAPILLAERELPYAALRETVTDTLGTPPLAVISHGEAVARYFGNKPIAADVSSLLFLSVGTEPHACLLLRDGTGRWCPSSLGNGLNHTLTRTLGTTGPSAEGIRRGVAVFLTDLCRFLRPDLIYMEDPRGVLPDEGVFASLLPDGVEVAVRRVEDSLTAAEEGAALAGRRMLWDKILFG